MIKKIRRTHVCGPTKTALQTKFGLGPGFAGRWPTSTKSELLSQKIRKSIKIICLIDSNPWKPVNGLGRAKCGAGLETNGGGKRKLKGAPACATFPGCGIVGHWLFITGVDPTPVSFKGNNITKLLITSMQSVIEKHEKMTKFLVIYWALHSWNHQISYDKDI